jgi:hypothetical protein
MKKIITLFLLFCITNFAVYAVDFDDSVDSSIRKNFNVEDSELPKLPSVLPTDEEDIPLPQTPSNSTKPPISTTTQQQKQNYNYTGKVYTIKKGTKINLVSRSKISDWSAKGTNVSFSASNGFTTKEGVIIPAGTIFRGTITNSHRPQIAGNGGLVELKIDSIYYKGLLTPISTKVSLANSKRIFKNDVKGKHSYWTNYAKAMQPGRKVFNATQSCASAMSPIPVINILAVVPLITGAVVYTVNFVAAPVIAIFSKGGSLSLPAGTQFQIKVTQDTQIRG